MTRREFVSAVGTGLLAAAPIPPGMKPSKGPHIVSLSFDDGFRKSFIRIAEIYEKFGLSACFNIIASAHLPGNEVRDEYMKQEQFGDFHLWNELQDRGHEIMPHGYRHDHLGQLPLEEAKSLILKSLDMFSRELRGFDPKKAVFNFPYNQYSRALGEWVPTVVRAFRANGGAINPLPTAKTVKITTGGKGPDGTEGYLDEVLAEFLRQPSGWLVFNLHGLDEEGWGPIRPSYLEKLLARLRKIDSVRVVPTARALLQAEKL